MPDLFEDAVSVEDFVLPSDAALEQRPADRPRDEQGRFAAADPEPEPVVEEPAAEEDAPVVEEEPAVEEPVAEEETAAERLYAGNFKNVDDLERAYEDLRSKFGQQGSELGDLRKAFEDRFAELDQRLQTPQAPPVQITADLVEQNPAYATVLAYEQNNPAALQIAFENWKVEDPTAAAVWLSDTKATEREKALRQEYEAKLQQFEQRLAPAAAAGEEQQLAGLVQAAANANPGLTEFVTGDQLAAVANEFPEDATTLATGTPDQKARALVKLFQIHRGRVSDNLAVSKEEIARTAAVEAQKVREEAFVASATSTSSGEKPSAAERIAAQWAEARAPIDEGWNI